MALAPVEGRAVVAVFDGGAITSDAGARLLGATDRAIRLVERFAGRFIDGRHPERVVHDVATLVGQRVFAIAMGPPLAGPASGPGGQDVVDHDELRFDPGLGVVLERLDARRRRCAPRAGKSTLNRLEHGTADASRYHRIAHDPRAIEDLFVELFLDAHAKPPKAITLDLDASRCQEAEAPTAKRPRPGGLGGDDPLRGHQGEQNRGAGGAA
jgi:hypothetical protein